MENKIRPAVKVATGSKVLVVLLLAVAALATVWVVVDSMERSRGECPIIISSEGVASLERENERLRLRIGSQSAQILQLDKLLQEATE
jgi:hypothetical protein